MIPVWPDTVAVVLGHSGLGYVCCAVVSGRAKTLSVFSFFLSLHSLKIHFST